MTVIGRASVDKLPKRTLTCQEFSFENLFTFSEIFMLSSGYENALAASGDGFIGKFTYMINSVWNLLFHFICQTGNFLRYVNNIDISQNCFSFCTECTDHKLLIIFRWIYNRDCKDPCLQMYLSI